MLMLEIVLELTKLYVLLESSPFEHSRRQSEIKTSYCDLSLFRCITQTRRPLRLYYSLLDCKKTAADHPADVFEIVDRQSGRLKSPSTATTSHWKKPSHHQASQATLIPEFLCITLSMELGSRVRDSMPGVPYALSEPRRPMSFLGGRFAEARNTTDRNDPTTVNQKDPGHG